MTGSTCTSNTPGINPNTPGINPRFLSSQLYNLKALENNHHPYFHWGDSNSNCHHRSAAPGAFIFCNIITGLKKTNNSKVSGALTSFYVSTLTLQQVQNILKGQWKIWFRVKMRSTCNTVHVTVCHFPRRIWNHRTGFTHSPHTQVVTTGCQQVWIHSLGVWDPHELCGGVGVIKGVPADELWTLLIQTDKLYLYKTIFKRKDFYPNNSV